ncbi:glycosyltransferase family 2 protein [Caldisericum sp.]|jgi:GT2 family glycosyltransferase|uniref:glycosyltransferase family 2 protein n=1 Tax=Caldisericum sp. TaxID=2499687 RepID=UPI003D1533D5
MYQNPKIYIILLNYNGWVDTIECLESVLRNDYPNYQVIVVDNHSPNNSMDYIKAWAEGKIDVWVSPGNPLRRLSFPPVPKPIPYVYYTRDEAEKGGNKDLENELSARIPTGITTKYPLIFIQSGANLGFAGGNNIGIRYALAKDDFDSVILLNNDTVIENDLIRKTMEAKLNLGERAIYGARILYYKNPDIIWYDGGNFNEWTGRAIHLNMKKRVSEVKTEKSIKEINFITFCYVLLPKFIIKNVGLLDESYFMYVEDLDYSYKVWKAGYKLYHITSARLYHKVGASNEEEVSEFSAYWHYKNSLKFRKKIKSKIKRVTSIYFYILTRFIIFFKWLLVKPKIAWIMFKGLIDEMSA